MICSVPAAGGLDWDKTDSHESDPSFPFFIIFPCFIWRCERKLPIMDYESKFLMKCYMKLCHVICD